MHSFENMKYCQCSEVRLSIHKNHMKGLCWMQLKIMCIINKLQQFNI